MQLQMTAPLDIGLEQHDDSLGLGQEDIFDLGGTERDMRKRGGVLRLIGEDGDVLADSDEDSDEEEGVEDDEVLDSEEERDKKTQELEAEMDGMYDAYQERMRERDAKFKVKESREKNSEREEWHGIQDHDSGGESEEEGGWDKVQQAKRNAGTESSSDEDSSDEEEEKQAPRKRRRDEESSRAPNTSKRVRLVTKLEEPKTVASTSKAAQVWFSQDVFTGMELDDIEDESEEEEEAEGSEMDVDEEEVQNPDAGWEDEVSNNCRNFRASTDNASSQQSEDDDDFEIVPREADNDADMWDVENENEDAVKQAKINSKSRGLILELNSC